MRWFGRNVVSVRDTILDELISQVDTLLPADKRAAFAAGEALQEFPPQPFPYKKITEINASQYSPAVICAIYTALDFVKKQDGLNSPKIFVARHGISVMKMLSPVDKGNVIPYIVDDKLFSLSIIMRNFLDKFIEDLGSIERYLAENGLKEMRADLDNRISAYHPDKDFESIHEGIKALLDISKDVKLMGFLPDMIGRENNRLDDLKNKLDKKYENCLTDVLYLELIARIEAEHKILLGLARTYRTHSESSSTSVVIPSKTVVDQKNENDSETKEEFFSSLENDAEKESLLKRRSSYSASMSGLSVASTATTESNSSNFNNEGSRSPSLESSAYSPRSPASMNSNDPVEEVKSTVSYGDNTRASSPEPKPKKSLEEISSALTVNAEAQRIIEGLRIETSITKYHLLNELRKKILKDAIIPNDDSLDEKILLAILNPEASFGVIYLADQDFSNLVNQLKIVSQSENILNGINSSKRNTLNNIRQDIAQHLDPLVDELAEKFAACLKIQDELDNVQSIKSNLLKNRQYAKIVIGDFAKRINNDDLEQAVNKFEKIAVCKNKLEIQQLTEEVNELPSDSTQAIIDYYQYQVKNVVALESRPDNVVTFFIRAVAALVIGFIGALLMTPIALLTCKPSLIFTPGEKVSGYLSNTRSSLFSANTRDFCASFVKANKPAAVVQENLESKNNAKAK